MLSSEKNRLHKFLEDANIKLSCVVSDIDGVTSRKLIEGLLLGEKTVSELVSSHTHRNLKSSKEERAKALTGRLTEHHKFMLREVYAHMSYLEGQISKIEETIATELKCDLDLIELLCQIPGVSHKSAMQILSEIGTDMTKFGSAKQLASWAGMCPGNNESGGKKKVVV